MVAHARWITYLKLKKYMGCSTDSATLLTWRHHACVMVKWSINDLKPGSRPANEITPSILSASVQLDGVLGRDKLTEDNPNMGKIHITSEYRTSFTYSVGTKEALQFHVCSNCELNLIDCVLIYNVWGGNVMTWQCSLPFFTHVHVDHCVVNLTS